MIIRIIAAVFVMCLAGVRPADAFIMTYDTLASSELGRDVEVAVMLPLVYRSDTLRQFPVLYALHGQGDGSNYTFWDNQQMKVRIMSKPMLVVMFKNDMSLYVNETDFFFNELIPWVDASYRTIANGDNRAITGFSSGGYGAMHYMLSDPEKFSSAIPMSGALDYVVDGFDVIQRVKDSVDAGRDVPPISIFCGGDDFLVGGNRELADSLEAWDHDYVYTETAGYAHDPAYWLLTCPAIVDYAWAHFSLTAPVHDRGIRAAATLPAGGAVRYDCRGQQISGDYSGVVIEVGADGAVRKALVR